MKFLVYYSPYHDQVFVCDNKGKIEVRKAGTVISYCKFRRPYKSKQWVCIGEFE